MPILRNVFKWVQEQITRNFSNDRETRLENASDQIAELLLKTAKEKAPVGQLDQFTWRYGQRPSTDRFGEETIADSLNTDGTGTEIAALNFGEAAVVLNTTSRHTIFFTEGIPKKFRGGTDPHSIPLKTGGLVLGFYSNLYGRDFYAPQVHGQSIVLSNQPSGDFLKEAYREIEEEAHGIASRAATLAIRDLWDRMSR